MERENREYGTSCVTQAIGETMLRTLLANEKGDWLMASEDIWVIPNDEKQEIGLH